MIQSLEKYGDNSEGIWRTRGKIVVLDHVIGLLESEHRQRGHFLKAQIRIRFDGTDPLAMSSVGNPHIWRSLAFRGDVVPHWGDIPAYSEAPPPFDRVLTLSYTSAVPGDEVDLEHVEAAANTDLAAINALIGSLIKADLNVSTARL